MTGFAHQVVENLHWIALMGLTAAASFLIGRFDRDHARDKRRLSKKTTPPIRCEVLQGEDAARSVS